MSKKALLLTSCFFILLSASAEAANITWGGATSTNWLTASNWIGAVPTSADIAFIPATANSPVISTPGAVANELRVGSTATTSVLTINNTGTLTTTSGYVGYAGGSTSTMNMTGTDARWNSSILYVGNGGTGTLNIQNGAQATGSNVRVGQNSTGVGTLNVTGMGSLLTTGTTSFFVANNGTATVNVQNGGRISSGGGIVLGSANVALGTATVTGAGSQMDAVATITVGAVGTGILNVEDGGKVTSTSGLSIASSAGSTGTVKITGANSQVQAASTVVGTNGTGRLEILNGGLLTNTGNGSVASAASTSTVLIDGANSGWNIGGILGLGSSTTVVGTGTVTVSNGGSLSTGATNTVNTLGNITGSTGTIEIKGAGSTFNSAAGASIGANGTGHLNITDGGVVNMGTGTTSSSLANVIVGRGSTTNSTATGTVTVDGAGSQLNVTRNLYIGQYGDGTLTISNGGYVSNAAGAYLGNNENGIGRAYVSGSGTVWDSTGVFNVGISGTGILEVSDNAVINANGSTFYVGNSSTANSQGTMRLFDNAILNTVGSRIGQSSGNYGNVHMSTGAVWNTSDRLYIGNLGRGDMIIDTGAVANVVGNMGVGASSLGSASTLLVTGNGSALNSTADIFLGLRGNGTMTLADGGMASTGSGVNYLYNYADSSSAIFTSTSTTYLGYEAGAVGLLNIGAAAGDTATSAGILNSDHVVFGAGTGTIVFNHTDGNYDFASDIQGAGTLNFVAGNTLLSGDTSLFTGNIIGNGGLVLDSGETTITSDSSAFTGTTAVIGGILRVNGSLGGTTEISGTGRLQGNANLDTLVLNSGSVVAPGNSIGTVAATNVTFNPGMTYEVEVNGAGQSDQINASGTATLNGGTVKAIAYPDFVEGTPYTILTAAGGISGAFDAVMDDYLFLNSALTQDANNVYLNLSVNDAAIQSAAQTPNQRAVVGAVISASGANAAINALALSNNIAELNNNLDRLSGEIHAGLSSALMADQRFIREAIAGNADEDENLAKGAKGRFWMHNFNNWSDTEKRLNTAQTDARTNGFILGAEKQGENYRAGIGAGISRTNLTQGELGAEVDSDNYHALAYGEMKLSDRNKAMVGASYTWHEIDSGRDVQIATFSGASDAKYNAQTAQIFGELSHEFLPDAQIYAQGAYILHKSNDFTENGAAGLSGDSEFSDIATSTLGIRLRHEFTVMEQRKLDLKGGLAWQHAYGDEPNRHMRLNDGGARFVVEGAPIDRDAALVTTGISTQLSPASSVNLSYDGGFSQNTTQHALTGYINWKF